MRASRRLPNLRKQLIFPALKRAMGFTVRSWFRIVHYSVQADHIHLLVEAEDKWALSRGLAGVAIRLALAVNRVLDRRGRVWDDRYHSRPLQTPREVRHGLVYVIMNWKKHAPDAADLDPCSSAYWFTGWRIPPALAPPDRVPHEFPLEPPKTWLLRSGWKRHGLIGAHERPKIVPS